MGLTSLKKQIEKNPLEKLEEAIKNRPNPFLPSKGDWQFDFKEVKKYLEEIEVEFNTFKKQCVCIPTKQLEELWEKLPMITMNVLDTSENNLKHIHKTADWVEKLEELLEESK